MKFLFQILAALICLIGLFFLLGYVLKTQTVHSEIEVHAPIETCWNVYQDESKISLWLEGVESIKLLTGVKGRVGSQQEIRMKNTDGSSLLGDASQLVRTITTYTPQRQYTYDYTSDMIDGSTIVNFISNDSTTIIKSEDSFRAKKLWVRSTLFILNKSIRTRTQSQFDKLKSLIETEHKSILQRDSLQSIEIIQLEN